MSSSDESGPRGRLLLVTAARAQARAALASAVATRLGRAVLVDGTALELAVTAGDAAGWDEPPTSEQLRMRLLRWSAALSVAETYQLEGFDAVVAEDALGDRLEDFLDLVEPEPVHVVVVADEADPATPRVGPLGRGHRRRVRRRGRRRGRRGAPRRVASCSRRRPPDAHAANPPTSKAHAVRLEADGVPASIRARGQKRALMRDLRARTTRSSVTPTTSKSSTRCSRTVLRSASAVTRTVSMSRRKASST